MFWELGFPLPHVQKFSDFSSRPWRNLPPTWVMHMATRRPAHKTPIYMDLVPLTRTPYKKSMWIGVLWAGLRVAMWITHVGRKFRHGLLEKSQKIQRFKKSRKSKMQTFIEF